MDHLENAICKSTVRYYKHATTMPPASDLRFVVRGRCPRSGLPLDVYWCNECKAPLCRPGAYRHERRHRFAAGLPPLRAVGTDDDATADGE